MYVFCFSVRLQWREFLSYIYTCISVICTCLARQLHNTFHLPRPQHLLASGKRTPVNVESWYEPCWAQKLGTLFSLWKFMALALNFFLNLKLLRALHSYTCTCQSHTDKTTPGSESCVAYMGGYWSSGEQNLEMMGAALKVSVPFLSRLSINIIFLTCKLS